METSGYQELLSWQISFGLSFISTSILVLPPVKFLLAGKIPHVMILALPTLLPCIMLWLGTASLCLPLKNYISHKTA